MELHRELVDTEIDCVSGGMNLPPYDPNNICVQALYEQAYIDYWGITAGPGLYAWDQQLYAQNGYWVFSPMTPGCYGS